MFPVDYREQRLLACRNSTADSAPFEVDGSLLVGTCYVLKYHDNFSQYGNDVVYLYPAFHKGERCWLRRFVWSADSPYTAYGTMEEIISFEDGVQLFLEQGVFEFPVPVESDR